MYYFYYETIKVYYYNFGLYLQGQYYIQIIATVGIGTKTNLNK